MPVFPITPRLLCAAQAGSRASPPRTQRQVFLQNRFAGISDSAAAFLSSSPTPQR